MNKADMKYLEGLINAQKEEFHETINELVEKINNAFQHISVDMVNHVNHLSKRLDDMDSRLANIEKDMVVVRSELTSVSNWTKTGSAMFDLTRTSPMKYQK